jgi:hypothetical protein
MSRPVMTSLLSPDELCTVTNFDLTLTQQTQLAPNPTYAHLLQAIPLRLSAFI